MSTVIDEYVASASFDGRKFEKGVDSTIKAVDKFKKSLNFEGSVKGLDKVAGAVKKITFDPAVKSASSLYNAVKKLTFGPIVDGCAKVMSKFKETDAFITTAIVRWSAKIQQFGEQMVKSLTIDNVKGGWNKYEQMTTATRTIKNATGKSIEEIDAVMDKLMEYSDETSYDFSKMAGYMSQFASSGAIKDLEKAEMVMEGIANASAHAGIGIREADGPMQTMVKALSRGKMQLYQWQSLQLSNFITPALINQFIEAGKALGTLDKEGQVLAGTGKNAKKIKVTQQSIADTLRYDWLTASVMEKAFSNYVDGMSDLGDAAYKTAMEAKTFTDVMDTMKDVISTGWMASFKLLIGNVDQASEFFTNMVNRFVDLVQPISEARNKILKGWNELGGRNDLILAFDNIMGTVDRIAKTISDSLGDVFGFMDSKGFKEFTENVQNATHAVLEWLYGNASPEGDQIAPRFVLIKNALKGFLAVWDLVLQTGSGIWQFFEDIVKGLSPAGDSILVTIGKLGFAFSEWVKKLKENKTISKIFTDLYNLLGPTIKEINESIGGVAHVIQTVLGLITGTKDATDSGKELSEWWKQFVEDAKKYVEPVTKAFESVKNSLNDLANSKTIEELQKNAGAVWEKIKAWGVKKFNEFTAWLSEQWPVVEKWIGDAFVTAGDWIKAQWPVLKKAFQDAVNSVGTWLSEKWDEMINGDAFPKSLKELVDAFTPVWESIKSLGTSIGDFVTNLFNLITGTTNAEERGKKFSEWLDNFAKDAKAYAQPIKDFVDKVVDAFKSLTDAKTIEELQTKVGELWNKVQTAITAWFTEKLPAIKTAIRNAAVDAGKWVVEQWPAIQNGLEGLIKKIGDFIPKAWNTITGIVREWFTEKEPEGNVMLAAMGMPMLEAGEVSDAEKDFLKIFGEKMKGFFDSVKDIASKVVEHVFPWFEKLWDSVKDLFTLDTEGLNLEGVGEQLLGLAPIFTALGLVWLTFRSLSRVKPSAMLAVAAVIGSLVAFLDKISEMLKDALHTMVDSMGIDMTEIGSFIRKAGQFVADIWKFLTENKTAVLVGAVAIGLISLGLGIKKLGVGLKVIGKNFINLKPFSKTFNVEAKKLLTGNNLSFKASVQETLKDKLQGLSILLGSITASVSAIVGLMSLNGGGKDAEYKVYKAAGVIAALGVLFTAIGAFAAHAKTKDGKQIGDSAGRAVLMIGGGILALVGGLWLLLEVVKELGAITDVEAFTSGSTKALGILISLALIMSVASGIAARIGGGKQGPGLQTLIGMAASMFILFEVFKKIFDYVDDMSLADQKKIWNVVWALGILSVGFGLMLHVAGSNGKVKSVLSMIGGFWVIVQEFKSILGELSKKTLDPSLALWVVGGFVALLLAMGFMFSTLRETKTKFSRSSVDAKPILALALAFYAIGEAFKKALPALNGLDWTQLTPFMGGLVLIFAMAAIINGSARNMKGTSVAAILFLFAGLSAVIYLIGETIPKLAGLDWTVLTAFMGGLLAIMLGLSVVMAVVKGSGLLDILTLVVVFAGVSALVYIMGDILPKLQGLSWETLLGFAGAIAGTLVGLGIAAGIAKLVGIGGFLILGGGLLIILTAVSAGMALAGHGLASFGNGLYQFGVYLGYFMDSTANVSTERMNEIVGAIDVIINEIGKMATTDYSGLTKFNTGIFSLGNRLFFFNDKLKNVEREKIQSKLGIVTDIKTAATDLNAVPNVGDLTQTIMNVGAAIRLYYENLEGIDIPDGESAPDGKKVNLDGVKQMISDLAKDLPADEDLLAVADYAADGESGKNLNLFAAGVTNLGTSLKSYRDSVKDIKYEDLESAAKLIGELKDIPSLLPSKLEIEGIFGKVTYESTTLTSFSTGVEDLAGAFVSMGTAIKGIDENGNEYDKTDALDKAATVAEKLADINKKLPSTGFWGWLTGQQTLGEFAGNLAILGDGMGKFVDGVAGKDLSNVGPALDFLDRLKGIQIDLGQNSEGFWANLFDATAMSSFKTNLKDMGEAVKSFYEGLFPSDPKQQTNYTQNKEQLDYVMDVLERMSKWSIPNDSHSFLNYIQDISAVNGRQVANFFAEIKNGLYDSGIYFEEWDDFTKSIDKVTAFFTSVGFAINGGIVQGLEDENTVKTSLEAMSGVMDKLWKQTEPYTKNPGGTFYTVGYNVIAGLASGLAAETPRQVAIGNMQTLVNNILATATGKQGFDERSPSHAFEHIGEFVNYGLAEGLDKSAYAAVKAMHSVSVAVDNEFRDFWGIHSNSDRMIESGKYMNGGTAEGLVKSGGVVIKTVKTQCQAIADTMGDGLGKVAEVAGTAMKEVGKSMGLDEKTVTTLKDDLSSLFAGNTDISSLATKYGKQVTDKLGDVGKIVDGMIGGASFDDMADYVMHQFGLSNIVGDTTASGVQSAAKVSKEAIKTGDYASLAAKQAAAAARKASGSIANGVAAATSTSAELGRITTSVSSGGLLLSVTDGYTIGDILSRMDRLENAITHMQLVLDTGVVAGGVAYGVDQQLGIQTTLEGRWN